MFNLKCDVSDKYKENNTNYKEKSFKYIISYKNVFAGGSQEQVYIGKYELTTSDGSCVEKETSNGVIELKPGEKIKISAIPVFTEILVKVELDEGNFVSGIKTTDQFEKDIEKGTTIGKMNTIANVVEYTISDKSENGTDDGDKPTDDKSENGTDGGDKLTDEEIVDITGEDNTTPEKLEEPMDVDGDAYDEVADTGDGTDVSTWAMLMGISIVLTIGSAYMLMTSKNRR